HKPRQQGVDGAVIQQRPVCLGVSVMKLPADLPKVLQEQPIRRVVSVEKMGGGWPPEEVAGRQRQPGQNVSYVRLSNSRALQIEPASRDLGRAEQAAVRVRGLAARPGAEGHRVDGDEERRAGEVPAEAMHLTEGFVWHWP